MFFEDLSPYPSSDDLSNQVKCIGWLSKKHGYSKGKLDDKSFQLLENFIAINVNQKRGVHGCEFCKRTDHKINFQTIYEFRKKFVILGDSELVVFNKSGDAFVAPNLIVHYIKEHSYLPPREFIEALYECPVPTSQNYFELLVELKFRWSKIWFYDERPTP